MPQVKIIAKNFMDMVASLPAIKLDMLYRNQFICEAILRSSPPPLLIRNIKENNESLNLSKHSFIEQVIAAAGEEIRVTNVVHRYSHNIQVVAGVAACWWII